MMEIINSLGSFTIQYNSIFPQSQFFCILALGSGQRLMYRLGSGLASVLVLRFCALNLINNASNYRGVYP